MWWLPSGSIPLLSTERKKKMDLDLQIIIDDLQKKVNLLSTKLEDAEHKVGNLEKAFRRLQRSLSTVKKPDIVRERKRPHLIDIYIDDSYNGNLEYDPSKTREEILDDILATDFIIEHLEKYPLIEATLEHDLSFASINCRDIIPKRGEGRFVIKENEVR